MVPVRSAGIAATRLGRCPRWRASQSSPRRVAACELPAHAPHTFAAPRAFPAHRCARSVECSCEQRGWVMTGQRTRRDVGRLRGRRPRLPSPTTTVGRGGRRSQSEPLQSFVAQRCERRRHALSSHKRSLPVSVITQQPPPPAALRAFLQQVPWRSPLTVCRRRSQR